jgi:hypothetical protein
MQREACASSPTSQRASAGQRQALRKLNALARRNLSRFAVARLGDEGTLRGPTAPSPVKRIRPFRAFSAPQSLQGR